MQLVVVMAVIRAGTALFPYAAAEVGLAEVKILADAESGSSQPGQPPSPHLHARGGTVNLLCCFPNNWKFFIFN
jgi:hypothetical protein